MDDASRFSKLLVDLFKSQKLAALSTQSEGKPYGCLVAFAATDDLKSLLFVTDRNTRKFRDISSVPQVAILIDNRSNDVNDFRDSVAVTAIGTAAEVTGDERSTCRAAYLVKHPNLADFLDGKNNALVRVAVETYVISSFLKTVTIQP